MQKTIILGNVGQAPEIRTTQGGNKVATLSVATSESWKDKQSGERKERTEWHRVVVWGALAEIVEKYVHKGDRIYIEGVNRTRKWTDQSGQEKYTTEVVVEQRGTIELQPRPNRDGGNSREGQSGQYSPPDFDDEIPF